MKIAGRIVRPGVLAAIFGAYFGVVMFAAWTFSSNLAAPRFGADLTRWVYTIHILASAVFLAGLGILGFHVQNVFETRVRDINRQLGIIVWSGLTSSPDAQALPPVGSGGGDPEEDGGDSTERDMDEMLEVLGEVQSEAESTREVLVKPGGMDRSREDGVVPVLHITVRRELVHRRTGLRRHQAFLARFLLGPAAMAVFILGVSMAMLPASEGMFQSSSQLNTAVILGFAYGWVGLAGYFAASSIGVVGSMRTERKRRVRASARRNPTQ